jgi:hypothetical protein
VKKSNNILRFYFLKKNPTRWARTEEKASNFQKRTKEIKKEP